MVTIEALSESTAERDHGRKRWGYQTIRSLRHYVLVDQDEGGIEVTSPNPDGTWQSVILRDLGDRLELTALEAEIGLEEVFARVAFPAPPRVREPWTPPERYTALDLKEAGD